MKNEATVIVGAQFGDEGKGKIIDALVPNYDLVVRFQGGNNAGHTVVVGEEKYKLHLLPSGIVRGKRSLIGAGVVLDPRVLKQEIDELAEKGIVVNEKLLGIDFRTQVIFPWHNALDAARESGKNAIGTTGRGIGPAYEDRAARSGIRVEDFVDSKMLAEKVKKNHPVSEKHVKTYGSPGVQSVGETLKEYSELSKRFSKFSCDVCVEVNSALEMGKRVLFEGAQGTLLDNDFGTYPFVTSSHPVAGGACIGVGVSPRSITRIEGVAKAYVTRVGGGPFPTELNDATGETIRKTGAEFGTTTGRSRRVGWLDIPMLKYSNAVNGFTGIHLTKLDVLGGLGELKLCTRYEVKGKSMTMFPIKTSELEEAKPVYVTLSRIPELSREEWKRVAKDGEKKGFGALPKEAGDYVKRVSELLGVPIISVSVGPERSEIIWAK